MIREGASAFQISEVAQVRWQTWSVRSRERLGSGQVSVSTGWCEAQVSPWKKRNPLWLEEPGNADTNSRPRVNQLRARLSVAQCYFRLISAYLCGGWW